MILKCFFYLYKKFTREKNNQMVYNLSHRPLANILTQKHLEILKSLPRIWTISSQGKDIQMCWNRERLSLVCEGKWAVPLTSDPLALDQTLRLVRLWGNFSRRECKMAQCRGRTIWPFLLGFFQMRLQSRLHTAALWEVAQGCKPLSPLIGHLANSMQWSPLQLCKEEKPRACLFPKASQSITDDTLHSDACVWNEKWVS